MLYSRDEGKLVNGVKEKYKIPQYGNICDNTLPLLSKLANQTSKINKDKQNIELDEILFSGECSTHLNQYVIISVRFHNSLKII